MGGSGSLPNSLPVPHVALVCGNSEMLLKHKSQTHAACFSNYCEYQDVHIKPGGN